MCMSKPKLRGFTLIEVLIFIVVVSAAMAGILKVINTSVAASADPVVRKQALALAESLLEEILLKSYANPQGGDTSTGTNRSAFDDVQQYNNYGTTAGMTDRFGTAIPALASYNYSPPVTVAASTDLTGVPSFKVTVTVTGPRTTITLSGYRSNY